jgi:hypothetical protein
MKNKQRNKKELPMKQGSSFFVSGNGMICDINKQRRDKRKSV